MHEQNIQLQDPLLPLRNITNQLQELRGRLDQENARNIAAELGLNLGQLNQSDENRLLAEEQNRDYTVLELCTEMQDLRNSAIRIVIGQIRTEAQAREYQRQNEILREIINELVQKKPNLINFQKRASRISTAYDNHIDELFGRIDQLSK